MENAFKYKVQQQQNGVIPTDLKNITINKLLKIYLEYSETNKKSYQSDVSRTKLIKQYFGETTLIKEITPEKIEKFKVFLLEQNRSTMTINRYLEQLKTAFRMAVDNNYLIKNPCQNIKKFPIKNYSVRYLKQEEEERLFKVLPEYLKGIVIIALNTGLRKSNILELRWEQINFDFNFIEILENKGNKHLLIPLNEKLKEFFNATSESGRKGYIFKNPETGLPYRDIKKSWARALKSANIENFRFHDLRHTVGTRLAEQSVPINVIKELLGHSDVHTTMRYVHSTQGAKLQALNKLNSYNQNLIQ